MTPSIFWIAHWQEERMHLRHMLGLNKRRDTATLQRLAQVERELDHLSSIEGVGEMRLGTSVRTLGC